MTDKDEDIVVRVSVEPVAEKRTLAQRFCDEFVYPFSKRRFYNQWSDAPLEMRFRLTNKCNERCPRCFECSGPENPLRFVPIEDIAFYNNLKDVHYKDVYMTGGEWSLVYHVYPHYLRHVFEVLDLSKSDEYIIQTNACWVNGGHRDEILGDIKYIQSQLGAKNRVLKLDTSVDRYRSRHSIYGVRDLICAVASDSEFKHTKIRIMSCALDYKMTNKEVLQPEYFASMGINLNFENRAFHNPYFQICYANNTRIVIHEESPTMQIGRAKENGIGYKIYYPQLQCGGLQPENTKMELSLREDGMIKWHNWYDWDIMVPYKDVNGKNKSLEQIRRELVDVAWSRALRHNIKNKVLDLMPIIGVIRKNHIYNQIKKSYDKNCQEIIVHLEKVH